MARSLGMNYPLGTDFLGVYGFTRILVGFAGSNGRLCALTPYCLYGVLWVRKH